LLLAGGAVVLMAGLIGGWHLWRGPRAPEGGPSQVAEQPGDEREVPIREKSPLLKEKTLGRSRHRPPGPIQLRLKDLSAGVEQDGPAVIPADADEGWVELHAAPGVARASATARLEASADAATTQGRFSVTVEAEEAPPPTPPPALTLLPLEDGTVRAGERATLKVRVTRDRAPGPIELSLEGLPAGVEAGPGLIRGGADQGTLDSAPDGGVAHLPVEAHSNVCSVLGVGQVGGAIPG